MVRFLIDPKDPLRQNYDPQEGIRQWNAYQEYLASVRDHMPKSAWDLAKSDWRNSLGDHRSLHDSWIDRIEITLVPSYKALHPQDRRTERSLNRRCEIRVRLLGAYWDGLIRLRYKDVRRHNVTDQGEWLYDEITMSKDGFVIHEVVFASGALWRIKCRDIEYSWQPFGEQDGPGE